MNKFDKTPPVDTNDPVILESQLNLFDHADVPIDPTNEGPRTLFHPLHEGLQTDGQRRWFFANLGKMDYTSDKTLKPFVASHSMEVSQQHAKNWTPLEKKALHDYTHQGSTWLNSNLRKGQIPPPR